MNQQYRITRELGRGGMGVVHLADDLRLGRQVAIKTMPDDVARDPARRKRFEQEARSAAALNHPNIASVYGLENDGDNLFIVFEYVEGQTLRHLVERGALPLKDVRRLGAEIAGGIAAAHARGIVHRDLKPENIIVTSSGSPKILDFGLARIVENVAEGPTGSFALSQAGVVMGTLAYMSPEQLDGKDVDYRSDIFSFGAMLYELATGDHPFKGEGAASTIARILTAEAPPLRIGDSPECEEFDRIVRRCLRKDREERYQSALDLKLDLARNSRPGEGPTAPPSLNLRWWLIHHLATMFVISPLVIYEVLRARTAMPTGVRPYLFFLEVFAIALNWSLRFVLVSTAVFNRSMAKGQSIRLVPWLWWSGWAIIAGLVAISLALPSTQETMAAFIAAWAMGGFVSVVFIEPSVRKSAFGDIDIS